jgi:hypothetical protein
VKTPAGSEDVVKEAFPALSATVPRMLDPFLNVTVSPFGGSPDDEVTVAVKVIVCPARAGFKEDVRSVVVAARTTWVRLDEVLAKLLGSPLYCAEME